MVDYEKRMEEIAELHEENKHFEIIKHIEEIKEDARDYNLIGCLARAYNNVGDFEKALELLLSIEEEGQHDLIWHFRIGYAYYYLDQLKAAEKSFQRVLKSDPGDSDALEFLEWIQNEIKESEKIKPEQEKAAMEQMIDWLSHENELGQKPVKIEQTEEFDLHGFHYYVYKYKKEKDSPWLLSVCGGFGKCDLDHCGHVFSEMEEYDSKTAKENAIKIVEMLREAWRNEAGKEFKKLKKSEESGEIKNGSFLGFVLLNSYQFDIKEIKAHLKNDWGILIPEKDGIENEKEEDSVLENFAFESENMMAAVSFIDVPVPNNEAVYLAETNYMWENAVEITKTHVAHLVIAVIANEKKPIDAALLHTKVASSCLKLENAVGIYTAGTVFQPEYYIDMAEMIHDGYLPILNWVYFGVYETEKGTCAYTYGLQEFGKDEIEIIDSTAMPESVHNFLIDIVYYVISNDITLLEGETIGFADFQKLKITKSKGVSLDGDTIKIDF